MYTRYCHSKLYWLVNGDSTVQTFRILLLFLVLCSFFWNEWVRCHFIMFELSKLYVCSPFMLICCLYIWSVLYLVYDWLHHTCHSSDTFTVREWSGLVTLSSVLRLLTSTSLYGNSIIYSLHSNWYTFQIVDPTHWWKVDETPSTWYTTVPLEL